jgi:hypothetical protein
MVQRFAEKEGIVLLLVKHQYAGALRGKDSSKGVAFGPEGANVTVVKTSTVHRRGAGARGRQLSLPRLPPPYTFLSRNTISAMGS